MLQQRLRIQLSVFTIPLSPKCFTESLIMRQYPRRQISLIHLTIFPII